MIISFIGDAEKTERVSREVKPFLFETIVFYYFRFLILSIASSTLARSANAEKRK